MFHLEKLEDMICDEEYAATVSNSFSFFDVLENLVKLKYTCKRETLESPKECIGEHLMSSSGSASVETLDNLEKSPGVKLVGNRDQYMALSCRT